MDYSNINKFPIEELQQKVQELLIDYREYLSRFSEKPVWHMLASKNPKNPNFQGTNRSQDNKSENMSEVLTSRYKHHMYKKMSIYSGSFGQQNITYPTSMDEVMMKRKSKMSKAKLMTPNSETSTDRPPKPLPNEHSVNCQLCKIIFNCFTWRHRCRNCNLQVCSNCSPYREYVPGYRDTRVRVCIDCYTSSTKYA